LRSLAWRDLQKYRPLGERELLLVSR
jgi:hypothetical protein